MTDRQQVIERVSKGIEMAYELLQAGHEGEALHTYLTAQEGILITHNGYTTDLAELSNYFGDEGLIDQLGRCQDTIEEVRFLIETADKIEVVKWA